MPEEVFIVGIIFFSIVAIVKIVSDNRTRNRLIDQGLVDERAQHLFGGSEASALSNLKWGMILVAIGAGFLISRWLPYRWEGEGALGLVLLFAGLAYLIYWPIAERRLKEARDYRKNQSPPPPQ